MTQTKMSSYFGTTPGDNSSIIETELLGGGVPTPGSWAWQSIFSKLVGGVVLFTSLNLRLDDGNSIELG